MNDLERVPSHESEHKLHREGVGTAAVHAATLQVRLVLGMGTEAVMQALMSASTPSTQHVVVRVAVPPPQGLEHAPHSPAVTYTPGHVKRLQACTSGVDAAMAGVTATSASRHMAGDTVAPLAVLHSHDRYCTPEEPHGCVHDRHGDTAY